MNIQEIFDTVSVHLLTQNKKSQESSFYSSCLYRGPNGTKCAVGCLIKDEFYDSSLENYIADSFCVINALELSGIVISEEIECLLVGLQNIHDTQEVSDWPNLLTNKGKEFNLDTSIIDLIPKK